MSKKNRDEDIFLDAESENMSILTTEIQAEPDEDITKVEFDKEVPVIPLRNMVMFPHVVMPITIGRPSTLKLVNAAFKKKLPVALMCQVSSETEDPGYKDIYHVGVIARILRIFELPGGNTTAIMQSSSMKVKLESITKTQPYMKGFVSPMPEEMKNENTDEFKALMDTCKELAGKYIEMSDRMAPDMAFAVKNLDNGVILVNYICSNFPFASNEKIQLLQHDNLKERIYHLIQILNREVRLAAIKQSIQMRTREDIDRQQKEYFLQQQIKNIQDELGGGQDSEIEELRMKASTKLWSKEVDELFAKEVSKLERINPQSPDYNVQLTYLQTLLALPWNIYTTDNLSIQNAEKTLNKDHYGLEKVKERILEHLAVLQLRGDQKSPIICLYGPPGVGKTSLGKSIAKALKRKYVRMSLGGMHDESEIRGHRRTYIGAMPGRIVKNLIKAGSSNPVFVLDEIDKVSQATHNGDPSSALLEVLDPEQNTAFHDNFLDIDYDLSRVMFIATANDINTIPRPLLDRMELIEVGGYITEEKIEIAKRHLVPKEKEKNGLEGFKDLKLNKSAIEYIIEHYTRESGVRSLEKQINKVFRKMALEMARTEEEPQMTVTTEMVKQMLGKPLFNRDKYQGNEYAGVVTGLAWTSVGGEILYIETSVSRGKSGKLTLTGNLGDVMKESAMLALEYIKAHADKLQIDMRVFDNYNLHIHVPEGAVPKDGPSAGITMATSIASALTQRKVRSNLAMTGEITLRGKVLPVGGIKEKILAAKRAGITKIILCEDNRKDIEEIPALYLKGLTFEFVESIMDVWDIALMNKKVDNAVEFTFDEEKEEAKG